MWTATVRSLFKLVKLIVLLVSLLKSCFISVILVCYTWWGVWGCITCRTSLRCVSMTSQKRSPVRPFWWVVLTHGPWPPGWADPPTAPRLTNHFAEPICPRFSASLSHCYGCWCKAAGQRGWIWLWKEMRAANYNSSNKQRAHSRYEPKVKFQNYNIHIHYSADITS